MTTKTIVFDFGNVIGYFDHRRALRRLVAHTSIPAESLFAQIYDATLEDEYESGRITSVEFLRRVAEAGQFRCSHQAIADAYADIFWQNEQVCALIPQLAGKYRLLLGSNTTELHARRFREQFAEPLRHFHALVLSYEVGSRKPRAAFFEHCQKLADCAPHECLFIDDLPANIAGAQACGWQGIVFRDFADLSGRLAELGILGNGKPS